MEVLSLKLGVAAENSSFSFHSRCRGLKLTHLAFADDLLLFRLGDVDSVGVLQRCLTEFFEMSGLRANVRRSVLIVDGVSPLVRVQIQGMLGYGEGSFLMTYLGYLLHPKKLSKVGCAGLILRVKALVEN